RAEESRDGGEIVRRVPLPTRTQHLGELLPRPVARVGVLAGIDTEPALDVEIVVLAPAAETRQVVRVEGGERAGGIGLRRLEAGVIALALEQHDAVSP